MVLMMIWRPPLAPVTRTSEAFEKPIQQRDEQLAGQAILIYDGYNGTFSKPAVARRDVRNLEPYLEDRRYRPNGAGKTTIFAVDSSLQPPAPFLLQSARKVAERKSSLGHDAAVSIKSCSTKNDGG